MKYTYVYPGQPFQPSADEENAIRRILNRDDRTGGGAIYSAGASDVICQVYNSGSSTISAGQIIKFEAGTGYGDIQPCGPFSGTESFWGVALQQMGTTGDIADCLLAGLATVPVIGGTGEYATPDNGTLTRSTAGARIVRDIDSTKAVVAVGIGDFGSNIGTASYYQQGKVQIKINNGLTCIFGTLSVTGAHNGALGGVKVNTHGSGGITCSNSDYISIMPATTAISGTSVRLGGVVVGNGLEVVGNGTVNVTAGGTGSTYTASTDSGILVDNATHTIEMRPATTYSIGGIIVGAGLGMDDYGDGHSRTLSAFRDLSSVPFGFLEGSTNTTDSDIEVHGGLLRVVCKDSDGNVKIHTISVDGATLSRSSANDRIVVHVDVSGGTVVADSAYIGFSTNSGESVDEAYIGYRIVDGNTGESVWYCACNTSPIIVTDNT